MVADEIDVVLKTPNFFVLGCPNCNGSTGKYGTLKVVNPETLEIISEV